MIRSLLDLFFGHVDTMPATPPSWQALGVEFLDADLERIAAFEPPAVPPLAVAPLVPLPHAAGGFGEPVIVVRSSCTCDATYWRDRCSELEVENDRLAAALGRLNTERALVTTGPASWGGE